MNFPMEYPIFQFFFWLVNTAGVGGVFSILVGVGSLTAYSLTLRWIIQENSTIRQDTFTYPTPALHHHDPKHQ